MAREVTLRLIEVAWAGPISADEITHLGAVHDLGVLAIYGSHPVFGDDALLYIDEAREAPFASRLDRIGHWLKFLPSEPRFYVGRLGGIDALDEDEWQAQINDAYRMLMFFHAPPWNSRGIDHHQVGTPTVVLNMGRRHRLQLEVSTLWDQSQWDPAVGLWRPFGALNTAAPSGPRVHPADDLAADQTVPEYRLVDDES